MKRNAGRAACPDPRAVSAHISETGDRRPPTAGRGQRAAAQPPLRRFARALVLGRGTCRSGHRRARTRRARLACPTGYGIRIFGRQNAKTPPRIRIPYPLGQGRRARRVCERRWPPEHVCRPNTKARGNRGRGGRRVARAARAAPWPTANPHQAEAASGCNWARAARDRGGGCGLILWCYQAGHAPGRPRARCGARRASFSTPGYCHPHHGL